jgi:glycosyltransferase involved in cell wall biosynthesis
MKVLFLTRYGYEGASSRYRAIQFFPKLREIGVACDCWPLLSDGYIKARFSRKKSIGLRVAWDYIRRISKIREMEKYDVIFVEKEVFPFFPKKLELMLMRRCKKIVTDYDDAVFIPYESHGNRLVRALTSDKISGVIAASSRVIAGSGFIRRYCEKFNDNVVSIPTSIDLAKYPRTQRTPAGGGTFTVGWIGSQSTTVYLKSVEKPIDEFCRRHAATFSLIGGGDAAINIQGLRRVAWNEDSEISELDKLDVGIMPLPDTRWAQGKCAFKLIQYMGAWKPVIASPVGENVTVVQPGVNGFLASSDDDWLQHLERLREDLSLRTAMGRAGRKLVEEKYCLDVTALKLADVLRSALD